MRSPFVPLLALCLASELGYASSPVFRDVNPVATSPTVDFLIVTSSDLANEFERLARWKTAHGLVTEVVTMQSILAAHPQGVDDAERLRTYLQECRARKGTRWVLLGGDVEVVPTRHVRMDLSGFGLGIFSIASDRYFACLDGTWNADGDTFFGEPEDDVDLVPELFVGRAPVVDAATARLFVSKTLQYERGTPAASTQEALLLAAGGLVDFSYVAESLTSILSGAGASVTRLYENHDAWPGSLPLSRASALDEFGRGPDFVVQGGRGSSEVLATVESGDPATYITIPDVSALQNGPQLSNFFLVGASTNDIDVPVSIGEALLRAPRGGAVSVLGPSNLVFTSSANLAVQRFVERLYGEGGFTVGEAAAMMFPEPLPPVTSLHALAVLGYLLLGDPTLRLHTAPVTTVANAGRPLGPMPAPEASARSAGRTTSVQVGVPDRESRDDGSSQPSMLALTVDRHARGAGSSVALSYEVQASLAGAPFELAVFDLAGRRVALLERGLARSGRFSANWSPSGKAPKGLYFVRLRVGDQQVTSRVAVTD